MPPDLVRRAASNAARATGDGTGSFDIDTSIELNFLNGECPGGWCPADADGSSG